MDKSYENLHSSESQFNVDLLLHGAENCASSENMLLESVRAGVYSVYKSSDLKGILKFTGSFSFLCTASTNPALENMWHIPVQTPDGEIGHPMKFIRAMLTAPDTVQDVWSQIEWRQTRKTSWQRIPQNILDLIEEGSPGLTVHVPEDMENDIMKYFEWQVESTENAY